MNSFEAKKVGDKWSVDIKADYKVVSSGLQNVLFQVCPRADAPTEEVRRKRRSRRKRRKRRWWWWWWWWWLWWWCDSNS